MIRSLYWFAVSVSSRRAAVSKVCIYLCVCVCMWVCMYGVNDTQLVLVGGVSVSSRGATVSENFALM
jgi:hypothetical protein